MNIETRKKLEQILLERKQNLKSIDEFDALFFRFSKRILKDAAMEINQSLERLTGDFLKIYNDDPFEFSKSRYFIMVILNPRFNTNMINFNSNETSPCLKFEGKEINGRVVISQRLIDDKSFKEITIFPISELTEEKTAEILVKFLENIFK